MPLEQVCRGCGAVLLDTLADLGSSPLSNSYLSEADLDVMEPTYPLHARVCATCFLVQVPAFEAPARIFGDYYAYFSSFSDTWLAHSRAFVENAIRTLRLSPKSRVVEVASNDGYLLQYFVERGIPAHGIEPAENVAQAARRRGVTTSVFFLGERTATDFVSEHGVADLVVANNVIAHVPDLQDFVSGLRVLLAPEGVLSVEFPHVLELIDQVQFDTIYHEHFSYLSLLSLEPVLARNGLRIFDAEEIATHGGSLRIWVSRSESQRAQSDRLESIRRKELDRGLSQLETYKNFHVRVQKLKIEMLRFLIAARDANKRVAAYGAAAKGNTLLNYCGIGTEFIEFVMDRNPEKAGKWLPGSRIPIVPPDVGVAEKPDIVLILPWNIKDEVVSQLDALKGGGTRFVVAIPRVQEIA